MRVCFLWMLRPWGCGRGPPGMVLLSAVAPGSVLVCERCAGTRSEPGRLPGLLELWSPVLWGGLFLLEPTANLHWIILE